MAPVIWFIADIFVYLGASAEVAYGLAELFVYVAATEIINSVTQSDKNADSVPGQGGNLNVNYTSTDASIRIVYGTIRTGGMETFPPYTHGAHGEYLEKIITIAGHAIDSYGTSSLGEGYLDDQNITSGTVAAISGSSGDGLVSSTPFANYAWLRRYTGASSDTTDYIFQSALPTLSAFLGKGFAKYYVTYLWSQNIFKSVPLATVIANGARVYDPRLDSTNGGSGSHRIADSTTWQFVAGGETYNSQSIGSNPVLCFANYLMAVYGGEVSGATEINWPTFIAAANVCDAQVAVPNGAGGSTTQDRYTCNGVLQASVTDWTDNIKPLIDAMLGTAIFANGVWSCYAGGWQAPTTTINKGDWVSGMQFTFDGGRDLRYNRGHVFFIDPAQAWTRQECYVRSNATYQAADGGEWIDLVTQQLLCTNTYEAQRKNEFLLRASRNQVKVSGKLPPRFQNILLWDTVTLNWDVFGWVSKTFRVVSVKVQVDGSVDVGLREEQSTDWTDLLYTDYGQPSTVGLPAMNPTTPSEPQNITITPQLNGTLYFAWTDAIVKPLGTVYQIIQSPNSVDATAGTVVWQGDALHAQLRLPPNINYYYMRSVVNTYVSAYAPNTFGTISAGGLLGNTTPNSVTTASVGSHLVNNNEIFVPNTVTPIINGQIVINASLDGWSTFDHDSGTYVALVLDKASDVGSSGGVTTISNSVVLGAVGGFTAAGSGSHLLDLSAIFNVVSGTPYFVGLAGKHAFGSQQINAASTAFRVVAK